MKTQEIETVKLIPYERNPKKHSEKQVSNVAESIQKFGFIQPIVVDKSNVVVIGHCRLLAAQKLGLEKVPCICVDQLNEKQVRALRVIDNKTNESGWDDALLKDELKELDLDDFDFDFDFAEDISDDDMDMFFEDGGEAKTKEPKRVQCPCCGEWFDL